MYVMLNFTQCNRTSLKSIWNSVNLEGAVVHEFVRVLMIGE